MDAVVGFGLGRRPFALPTVLALTTTVMVTLSACGSTDSADGGQDEDGQREGSPPTARQRESGPGEEAAGGGQHNPEPAPPDDGNGAGGGAAKSKVYRVGEAGEVDLRVDNGRPVLVEARPNAGWSANVSREGSEVNVHFRRGEAEWEFEAESEHGGIEVKSERGG